MKTDIQIISVIRGKAHWSSLNCGEIVIRKDGDQWIVPSLQEIIAPKLSDVASGILNLYPRTGELQEWASFLLAASPLITFDAFESSQDGEFLLNILWDLSSSEDIHGDMYHIAEIAASDK